MIKRDSWTYVPHLSHIIISSFLSSLFLVKRNCKYFFAKNGIKNIIKRINNGRILKKTI